MGISAEQIFAKEMGWYPMLYVAAGEDYTKINEVTATRADEFLTFMNFYKRKSQLDNKRIQSNNK